MGALMYFFRPRALFFVILVFSAAGALADSTMTWRQDVTGNYATGTNWVGSVAPTSADTAYINSGTAILFGARPAAARNLFLNGGTLDLAGFNMGVGGFSGLGGVMVNTGTSLSTFTMNSTVNSAYTGSLLDGAGALGFLKQGTSLLTLSGSSSFSGGFNLNGGGLILGNASALGTGTLTLGQVATLDATTSLVLTGNNAQKWNADLTFKGTADLNLGTGAVALSATRSVTVTASTLTVGGGISGATASSIGLTKNGVGTLVLDGANTFLGPLTISSGTLQLGTGGTGASLTSAVVDNGVFVVNHSDAQTLAGTISGNGRLIKIGSGTLTLSGTANSYSGGTTLNEGSIILGSSVALGSAAGSLTVNGGTLDLAGRTAKVGLFSGSGGSVGSYSGGAATLSTTSNASGLYSGLLEDGTGTLALIKAGAGTLTLTNANTYSGGTLLSGGGLDLRNDSALGTGLLQIGGNVFNSVVRDVPPSTVPTLINNSGSAVTLAANNLQFWNADFDYSGSYALNLGTGSVALNATRALNIAGPMLTVGGVISSTSATAGLTKRGLGTLVLTEDNTFGGVTSIISGTLQLGVGGTTGSLGTGSVVDNATLSINRSSDLTMAQTISGNGRLIKDSEGALTLGGTNSYSGGTTLNGGGITLTNAKGLGASTGDLTVNSGTLNLGANNVTVGLLSGTGGVITVEGEMGSTGTPVIRKLTTNSSKSGTFAGSLTDGSATAPAGSGLSTFSGGSIITSGSGASGSGILTLSGTGATINNLSSMPNGTKIIIPAGGVLHTPVGDYTGPGSYTYDSASGTFLLLNNLVPSSVTITGGITGTSGLIKTGAGTLTLAGSSSFSQGLLALEKAGTGALTLSGSNSYSGGTTLSGGGLNIAHANALGTGPLAITGAVTLDNTSGSALTLASNPAQTWNANFTFRGSGALDLGTGDVTMNATRTVTVASSTLTVGGAISGTSTSFGLTKSGTGTLVLAGNNTYGGATTISQGTLQLGNGGTTGSLGAGAVANSATFAVNRGDDFTLANTITGAGKLVQNGLGTLTVSGTNTYTGGTIVNSGSLVVGNSKALGAASGDLTVNAGILDLRKNDITVGALSGSGGAITVGGGAYDVPSGTTTLTTNTSKNTVLASALRDEPMQYSGGGGGIIVIGPGAPVFQPQLLALVKAGSGTLTLAGNNNFNGGTFLMAGGLNLVDGYSMGGGIFTIGGVSTIDNISGSAFTSYGGGSQAWNADFTFKGSSSLAFDTGEIVLNGNRTVTVASNTLSYGGNFSGATPTSGLIKSGTGTLVLGGNNTYGGNTTVSAGTLQFSGSLGGGSIFNSGVLVAEIQGGLDLNNTISGSGRLIKNNTGMLVLSGTNTYTGGTTLNDGVISLGNAKGLGATTGELTINGGILDLNDFSATVGRLSGTGGLITNLYGTGTSKLTTNSGLSGAYAGDISDGSGVVSLEKAGSGILTLSGSNSHSGGTILSGGGLNLNHASALGTGLFTISGVTTLDNTSGSALTLATNNAQAWNSNFTFRGSSALDLGTGNVTMNATRTVTVASSTLTVGGAISGTSPSFGLTKSGTGTLVLAGENTYTGATTISQGTLQLGNGGASGSLQGAIINNATFVLNRSDDGILGNLMSGVGRFVKNGAGAVELTGTNTYSGGTVLNEGSISLGNVRALGAATGDLTVNGGSLDLRGFSPTVGLLSGSGGSIVNTTGASTLTTNTAKSGSFAGTLADQGGTLALFKAGTGTLTLSGSNSHGGGTILSGGGLNLNHASALGTGLFTIAGVTTLDNTTGSALTLVTNNAQAWNSNFTFRGSSALDLGTGNVTMNASRTVTVASSTLTVGGTISGATSTTGLTKAGAGTLVLTANNAYNGPTTISQGTLQLGNGGPSGALGVGAIVNNATLAVNRSEALGMSNIISGSGRLVKDGSGVLQLNGASSYTGGTVINSGLVTLGNTRALGATTGDLTVNGGVLNLSANSITVGLLSGTGGIIAGSSSHSDEVLTVNSSKSGVYAGSINDVGTDIIQLALAQTVTSGSSSVTYQPGYYEFTPSGTSPIGLTKLGTFLFSASSSTPIDYYSAPSPVSTLSARDVSGVVIIGGGSGTSGLNTTVPIGSGTLSLPGDQGFSLVKAGSGTLTLSGSNNYRGGTTLSAGGLNLGNANALGTGTLKISGVSTLDNTTGSALTLATNNEQEWNANFTFKGSSALDLGTGNVMMNATRTVTVASSTLTVGGTIGGATATTGLTKSGTGTLLLTGNNVYGGVTTISQGTLQLGNGGTTGSLGAGAIVNNAIFVLNRSDDGLLGSVMSGSGKFVKNGAGAVTLTGANTYSGGTIVNAGELHVGSAKALGTGRVTLNAGSLLATDGVQHQINIGSNLVWDTDARISLTLTSDPLTSESVKVATTVASLDGGPLTFIFNDPALAPSSKIAVLTVGRNGFSGLTAGDFQFESNDSSLSGFFTIEGTILYFNDTEASPIMGDSGASFEMFIVQNPSSFTLLTLSSFGDFSTYPVDGSNFNNLTTFGAVPEPSTWALLALALGALPFLRRLRAARSS